MWGSLNLDSDNSVGVAVGDAVAVVLFAVPPVAVDNAAAVAVVVADVDAVVDVANRVPPHHPPENFSSVYRVSSNVPPVRRG